MKDATKAIVITKKGEISKSIKNAIGHCRFEDGKIYTGYYNGSGKWATATSAAGTVRMILNAEGFEYKSSNDAPKGGITGEHFIVSNEAVTFIQSLK